VSRVGPDPCQVVAIRRERLPRGDAGILRTVELMRGLVERARGHPVVRHHAELAVQGVRPGHALAEVLAVRDYVARHTEYRRDPRAVEWLQAPWHVLRCQVEHGSIPQLDCDDLTDLSLSLVETLGHKTAFRVVSHRPDRQFNHVYGLVQVGPEWWRLDLVDTWRPPGARTPAETRVLDVAVR